ncbi:MAG TPA: chromosomal replication initiator protein DnaA [Candidatus Hydrogenedentes bacterium]|nr:chromosomal replication initiator protein DnaA [Candidatus Hydrogenedentota bacterium]HIJ73431.1 chromosomal replication initiator protein DnaA [Candidatus Hydrogenedentota bacterium]
MGTDELNPWDLAQQRLRETLDEHSYKNWFSQTRYEAYESGCLVVGVPSQFFADWLRDHYLDSISESVGQILPDFREIRFVTTAEASPAPAEGPSVASAPKRRPARKSYRFNGFNPRYTFGRFVVGAGNRFAHAAAKAVAESPSRAYNPLFLYGGTGLGKTHLMQATGQEIIQREPDANVVFISSEQFTNQLIESIAKKSTQVFRAKYRKVDVLLIDDIHFIAGKEATQEEFFHTFNALFDMRKQIVLSSDRGPKEIQGLEDRLVSRFEWGLVTDIQPPDLETRVAILQNKAGEEHVTVPPEVTRYIATCVSTNIRELEGALITVLAFAKLTEQPISLALVEEVLRDLIGSQKIRPITSEAVLRSVAEYFDVRIADLRGRSRQRQIAFPRQIAMFLCKELVPTLSLNEIGEAFGGKDHTTVLYACQKIQHVAKQDESVRQTLSQLEKAIRA